MHNADWLVGYLVHRLHFLLMAEDNLGLSKVGCLTDKLNFSHIKQKYAIDKSIIGFKYGM